MLGIADIEDISSGIGIFDFLEPIGLIGVVEAVGSDYTVGVTEGCASLEGIITEAEGSGLIGDDAVQDGRVLFDFNQLPATELVVLIFNGRYRCS